MKRYGLFTGKFCENREEALKAGECCIIVNDGEEEETKKRYEREEP